VACGTIDSRLLIFESGELVSELQYMPNLNAKAMLVDEEYIQPPITAMASFVNGLFIGLETGALIYYEKIDEHPFYRRKKEEKFEDSPVTYIAWNARDDRAVVTVKSNQLYLFQIENDQKGETIKHDRLSHSFHSGPVLSIDLCLTKPLIASSGADKTIRLWNYTENSLEVINCFDEPANCITIHPNGLYILAGFASCVRLMAILLDDIKTVWENPIKSARGVNRYFILICCIV
jgi:WD40 repeat protein